VDPFKLVRCESTFANSFAKAESKGGCLTTGDASAIEAKVDAFVSDLNSELDTPVNPNACEGEKIKAAGKKAECKCKLEAKQAGKGGAIDPAKVAKCEATFSKAFAKSEAKGGCTTTGDAAAIEAKVDAFVADVDTELPATTTTTTSTTSTTLVCCDFGPTCGYRATAGACGSGTAGPAGSQCDGTGACNLPPVAAGPCCDFDLCTGGNFDQSTCMKLGGYHPSAICGGQNQCEPVTPCTPGTACGSCGTGFCVDHCNGASVIGALCVTNTVGPCCQTDADCAATPQMPYCISNGNCGASCSTAATCRALCE
jgi:hypothetical protein